MRTLVAFCTVFLVLSFTALSQKTRKEDKPVAIEPEKTVLEKTDFSGLKFRTLGPALTSGRIADLAVHAQNPKTYYVAAASGGVWKTVNAGTTYDPVFDSEGSYSIGCIVLDPSDPNVVWVGTGENNNQRSVAYGDGVYKSTDGGKSWKNMGLSQSEHIGKIAIHPSNSNLVYVAAYGPLWKEGGDRGVYMTKDGGKNWQRILELDEHTGANEILMDPRDPNVLYVATHQRRRHVFTYVGSGPGSTIYKSTDGGTTWEKAVTGLPTVEIGRIGLALAPSNPDMIYAIIEAAEGKSGVFRSTDRAASWEKRGGYSTSGNYYQEITVDPMNPDKLYSMDVWLQVSLDGGKTFNNVGEDTKHVDNHCIWIDPHDPDHLLVGCDGGIYETWDAGKKWHFKANLPVIQFYKVAVDHAEPFYHIYGGTQDNFSLGGPSRTVSGNGIANEQWFITHGGDGFESQVDPYNPNIVYTQSQHGVLARYDRVSGEEIGIQPHPHKGENEYRWNWDSPLAVSPHARGRLYFCANKVFRSDDYGNNWSVISEDLTRQINRNTLKVMGRVISLDAVAKNGSTSLYGNIVAFAESPVNAQLLFVGTDDGLIQRTTNGGTTWDKIENIPGVPERTYVNAIHGSMHDANVVYACFNHHKYGDFKPYVFKSTDQGNTWTSMSGKLPERGSAYSIMEDHVDPNLLFVGTEFGVFFTNDAGKEWKQLKAGVPTIAVRDMDIQRRENDLVLGTFGRGFFVLDDYSALRNSKTADLEQEAVLYNVRDPYVFEISYPLGLPGKSFQGDAYWQGENLGPCAMFTYYLKEKPKSKAEERREKEKKLIKEGKDVSYPTYEAYKAEKEEEEEMLHFTITNGSGEIVRKIETKPEDGVRRLKWDLRTASKDPISLKPPAFYNPWAGRDEGTLVAPGVYTVTMSLWDDGEVKQLGQPISFTVKKLDNATMPAEDRDALVVFKAEVSELARAVDGSTRALGEIENELLHIRKAISRIEESSDALMADVRYIEAELRDIRKDLQGDGVAATLDIWTPPSVSSRVGFIVYEQKYSTSAPTGTHRASLQIAEDEFRPLLERLRIVADQKMVSLREKLKSAAAPYTPNALPEIIRY
ncbi:MAG TPA: hypothetical protein VI603_00660 [Saprospiraceae bacterium]|nr:hypothetical protein [Saprospiraceae bacterium]